MTTALAYIRVSKDREQGVSPAAQLEKIRAYCELHDIGLLDVHRDLDLSGRAASNRPALQEMLARVAEGGTRYVVVYRLDRFSRSVKDFHDIMARLDKTGCDLISVSQNFDTSSAAGRLLRNLLMEFAQFESEMIGERLADAFGHIIRQQGKYVSGAPPYGYRLGKSGLLVHEEEATIVRQVFEAYAGGRSMHALAADLTARGVPTPTGRTRWGHTTIRKLLRNPTYIGQLRWNGSVHRGNHPPLVAEEVFRTAQHLIELHGHDGVYRPPGQRLFSGLLRCGLCGQTAGVRGVWNGQVRYACQGRLRFGVSACGNILLVEPSLAVGVQQKIAEVRAGKHGIAEAERNRPVEEGGDAQEELAGVEARLARLKGTLDRLFDDHYGAEVITREQFVEANRRYLAEQEALHRREEELRAQAPATRVSAADLDALRGSLDELAAGWEGLPVHQRRLALSMVIREVVWTPETAVIHWQWGAQTPLPYVRVLRRTGYFDLSYRRQCGTCGDWCDTPAGLASHRRGCVSRV